MQLQKSRSRENYNTHRGNAWRDFRRSIVQVKCSDVQYDSVKWFVQKWRVLNVWLIDDGLVVWLVGRSDVSLFGNCSPFGACLKAGENPPTKQKTKRPRRQKLNPRNSFGRASFGCRSPSEVKSRALPEKEISRPRHIPSPNILFVKVYVLD